MFDPYAICPTYDDRWDLRTRTLGCHVNTLTVVTCIVTVVCTLLGLLLVTSLWNVLAWCFAPLRGNSGGWEVVKLDQERVEAAGLVGRPWQRKREWRRRLEGLWWRWTGMGKEVGVVEERRRLLDDS